MDFIDDVSPLEALIIRHNERIDAITEDACRKLDAIKPAPKKKHFLSEREAENLIARDIRRQLEGAGCLNYYGGTNLNPLCRGLAHP